MKGKRSARNDTLWPIITCPVCGSHGEMLHHDIRASLVYSCKKCLHEWQIDPAEEPPPPEFRLPEDPRTRAASSKRHKVLTCEGRNLRASGCGAVLGVPKRS